jgi:hypothetical protein
VVTIAVAAQAGWLLNLSLSATGGIVAGNDVGAGGDLGRRTCTRLF